MLSYAKRRLNEQKYEIEQRDLKERTKVYITIDICDGNTVKRIKLLIWKKINKVFSTQSILKIEQGILWFAFNSILIPLFTVISLLLLISQISIVNNTIIIIIIIIINIKMSIFVY